MRVERKVANRLFHGLVILVCGLALFMFRWFIPEDTYMYYIAALTFAFLALTVLSVRNGALHRFWPVFFAFSISGLILTLNEVAVPLAMVFFDLLPSRVDGYVWLQFTEAVVVVLTMILLIKLQGGSLKSLYLKRGNLRRGLILGLLGLVAFAVATVAIVHVFFQGTSLTLARLSTLAPWIALFAASNGPAEELWFRGLFLKRHEKLMGPDLANLLQALIFTSARFSVKYAPFLTSSLLPPFLLATFILGLVLGELMQKTDSILVSALIRAGANIPMVIAVFASL